MTIERIFIPCEIFDVNVETQLHGGFTQIDYYVLEFLDKLGDDIHFNLLAEIFGLGNLPMLHIVDRLWENGLITLDLSTSTIRRVFGKEPDSQGNPGVQIELKLMQELLRGHILLVPSRPTNEQPDRVISTVRQPDYFRPENAHQLIPVIQQLLQIELKKKESLRTIAPSDTKEHKSNQADHKWNRQLQICSANIHFNQLWKHRKPGERRNWELHVQVNQVQGGGFYPHIVYPALLSTHIRSALEQRISETLLAEPNRPLTRILFKNSEGNLADQDRDDHSLDMDETPCTSILEHLESDVNKTSKQPLKIDDKQKQWRVWGNQLLDHLTHNDLAGLAVELLTDQAVVHDRILNCIDQASEQLVLVYPNPTWRGFRPYYSALEKALKNGVLVWIIWGKYSNDKFSDQQLLRNIRNLQERYDKLLQVNKTADLTEENLLIGDGRSLLLGSGSLFDFPVGKNSFTRMAAMITLEEREQSNRLANSLLDRLRQEYPHFQQGQKMLFGGVSGSAQDPKVIQALSKAIPDFQALLTDPDSDSEDSFSKSEKKTRSQHDFDRIFNFEDIESTALLNKWHQFIHIISNFVENPSSRVETVIGTQHNLWLKRVVQVQAQKRLFIYSQTLSDKVWSSDLVAALAERVQDGVHIIVACHHNQLTSNQPPETAVLNRIDGNGYFKFYEGISGNGSILLWDDHLLVTGMSLLSTKASSRMPPRRTWGPRQAGILIHNNHRFSLRLRWYLYRKPIQALDHLGSAT